MIKQLAILCLALILTLNLASAIIINSVYADTIAPGEEGLIRIEVENTLSNDVEDVSLTLSFKDLPFTPIGSSEQTVEEIEEDDDEEYVFRIRSAFDITPGDYEIPYTLRFDDDGTIVTRTGTIGIKVSANPDLVFSVDSGDAIENRKGQITFRIVNKGFSDARFVSIRVLPEGFTLLSDDEVYIGEVESDDFETATFNVKFKDKDVNFNVIVEYRDFDNKVVIEDVNLALKVYTREEALELGLIKPNRTPTIIGVVVAVILLWILWRTIKKQRRLKRSMQNGRR